MVTEENRFAAADRLKLGRPEGRDIEKAREAIRGQAFESAFAWDAQGSLVAARDGSEKEVFLLNSEWEKLSNGVVLHNHPDSVSFSVKDLNKAKSYNIARMEVVTKGYIYLLQPPKSGWELVSDKIWEDEIRKLLASHQEIRDNRKRGTMTKKALEEEMHKAMEAFCREVHVGYGRIEG